jgi:hypothetical protein
MVADLDDDAFVRTLRANDQSLGMAVRILHRFRAVANEVHQDLLNLDPVGKHRRQGLRQLQFHRDAPAIELVLGQTPDLVDDLVDVQRCLRWRRLFEKGADTPDDIRRRVTVPDDAFYRRPCARQVGIVAGQPILAGLCAGNDSRQRLVDFVGNGRRELGDRCSLRRSRLLGLRGA